MDDYLPKPVKSDELFAHRRDCDRHRDAPETHPSLPVIAMSGGGRSSPHGYLQIARGAGAASVLAKPFEMQTLLSTVKALVGAPPPGA